MYLLYSLVQNVLQYQHEEHQFHVNDVQLIREILQDYSVNVRENVIHQHRETNLHIENEHQTFSSQEISFTNRCFRHGNGSCLGRYSKWSMNRYTTTLKSNQRQLFLHSISSKLTYSAHGYSINNCNIR